jgi:4-carboxymuconolactone decarboxylase
MKRLICLGYFIAGLATCLPCTSKVLAADGEPRFSQFTMEQLNDIQKHVAERILKVSSAGLGGPYSILLRSPDLAERYLNMTDYLRFKTSLPHRLRLSSSRRGYGMPSTNGGHIIRLLCVRGFPRR